eukprot:scaffold25088_cov46-Cyclotella_meneghiniana.AAC.1
MQLGLQKIINIHVPKLKSELRKFAKLIRSSEFFAFGRAKLPDAGKVLWRWTDEAEGVARDGCGSSSGSLPHSLLWRLHADVQRVCVFR